MDKEQTEEQLQAMVTVMLLSGYGIEHLIKYLEAKGIPRNEASELIVEVNAAVSRVLKRRNIFLTGCEHEESKHFLCSDPECLCPGTEQLVPGKTGFLYISKEVVRYRRDLPTIVDLEVKVLGAFGNQTAVVFTPNTALPILVCKEGAERRHLDLAVAANDAKALLETGQAPLRPTPITKESFWKLRK